MVDIDEAISISHGNKLKDLFPGYHPPAKEERRNAYRCGLVSLDANALLDLYRFNGPARNEFFEVLEKLRPRLFITHQAALEFYRNRLSVVEDRLSATEKKCEEIERALNDAVVARIQEFANRHQIDTAQREKLIGMVEELSSTLADSIRSAGAYDLTKEQVRNATDTVLGRLQSLLADRVGDIFGEDERKQALREATRRREDRIPPGYIVDTKAPPEWRVGDYFVWRQLINEARVHDKPVLLVTNEQKEDWILKGSCNQILGPRPELVLEMQREADVMLHMVTVVGLLKEAPEYLGATVSPSTIQEAESAWYEVQCTDCGASMKVHRDWSNVPSLCRECKATRAAAWYEVQCEGCSTSIKVHRDWSNPPKLCRNCRANRPPSYFDLKKSEG